MLNISKWSGKQFFIAGLFLFIIFGGTKVYYQSRGLRNNNPTNIRKSGDKWRGLADDQNDSDFFIFSDPIYGIRAAARILQNYSIKYGLNTIDGIIKRWAPATENNTESYIAHVENLTSKNRNQILNLNDAYQTARLIAAIITHENGFNPYTIVYIQKGVELA